MDEIKLADAVTELEAGGYFVHARRLDAAITGGNVTAVADVVTELEVMAAKETVPTKAAWMRRTIAKIDGALQVKAATAQEIAQLAKGMGAFHVNAEDPKKATASFNDKGKQSAFIAKVKGMGLNVTTKPGPISGIDIVVVQL